MMNILQAFKEARESKIFEYQIGDQVFKIRAYKASPGAQMVRKDAVLLSLYETVQIGPDDQELSELTEAQFKERMSDRKKDIEETAEIFAKYCAILPEEDIETAQEIFFTPEEVMEHIKPSFQTHVLNTYIMFEERTPEVQTFPETSDEQE